MHRPGKNRGQRHCLADESGQVLILTALCMVVLVGMLGLSVDVGMLRYQKRQLQNAADAAALAGALELTACGSTQNCAALQAAAQAALKENGLTGSTLLTNCAKSNAPTLLLTVNNSPCALSGDPNSGNGSFVEVIVSAPVSTAFARIFGLQHVLVSAHAEAALNPGAPCIYALEPSNSNTLQLNTNTLVNAMCGIVVESSSSNALQCNSAQLTANHISVVGGVQQNNCFFSVQPKTGASVPSPADPLASLPLPSTPSCGSSTGPIYYGSNGTVNVNSGQSVTLYPNFAYCGGININNGANVTFMPGTYVLGSGSQSGGLMIQDQATVTGSGVTFYNYGSSGNITFNNSNSSGGVNLIAPTSGTYAGILIYQNSRNNNMATIQGAPQWNTVLEGGFYFPSASVQFNYNGNSRYNFLVARQIQFVSLSSVNAGHSTFPADYSSLANGSPLGGSASASIFQ